MADIRFYHLTRTPLESALPKMLEKVLEREQRAVVLSGDEKRLAEIDQALWSYRPDSFLPHGTKRDGLQGEHPIWLTVEPSEIKSADVIFLIHGASTDQLSDIKASLCAILFDGNNNVSVQGARSHWKSLKTADHDLTYWQQTERGGWEKKA
ncbi:DNA polymerase III subunit chi [Kiloniella laminariae]|uniref:DNA polymerase III subunit chi n=1 Tax=Kiloniella laminariae TaxID=454162 RepID=A0ABT4LH07_9PROT|nr:DNA polymerase III subunit chi [Kiloniella laminariae]MCZ4280379.1 DNA polymerase III subunit chi [Kiloniella laminariae]